jgi:ureidoacrylate peracid hydrolase
MELRPENAALIVIDMQNCLCKPDGSVASIGLDVSQCIQAIKPCCEVLDMARAHSVPVIFTRYVLKQDYSDGGIMIKHLLPELAEKGALKEGSHDAEIIPEMNVRDDEIVLDKNRPSSFHGTDLDGILERMGVSQLIVCGVTTNCCVETTVRDASQRDYEVFVVGDACGELEEERHRVALKTMDMLFADVVTVNALRATLSRA